MDPDATLRDLLDALEEADWDSICELSRALLAWMKHNGFPPTTLGSQALGPDWHRTLTKAVCREALIRAEAIRKKSRPTEGSA